MVDGVLTPVESAPAESKSETKPVKIAPKPVVKKVRYTTEAVGVWRIDTPEAAKAVASKETESETPIAGSDSAMATDSTAQAADTVVTVPGMVLDDGLIREEAPAPAVSNHGMSWIFLGLGILFCIAALKFKNNTRYLKALLKDLTDVRVRQNIFDETVKETSFLILLNVLWVCCAGVLLWQSLLLLTPSEWGSAFPLHGSGAAGIGICSGVAALYLIVLLVAYTVVGNVFSDSRRTLLWVKGAAASFALETIFLFPLALISICYAAWAEPVIWIAASVFVVGKIVFIYKGFRIFFNQISSWMLFLYYLCSLEIVPLILTYLAALELCSILL